MKNKCPNCETEVKEGFKFCLSCGAPLQSNVPVDTQNFESQVATPPTQQQPTQPSPKEQTYGQTQTHAPMQPKKTNMKLIGGIITIIVVIIVVALVVFLFIGGGGIDSNLVGTWETEEFGGLVYKFNSDGSLEMGIENMTQEMGTWSVSSGQLCMTIFGQVETCGSYSLDGNKLTMTFQGQTMTFYKK